MKKLLASASVIAFMVVSSSAFAADDATTDIIIEGTAEEVCQIPSGPVQQSATNASAAGNVVTLDDFIDDIDATVNAASITLQFENVMCNYAAKLSLESASGGLAQQTGGSTAVSGSGSFLNHVNYTAGAVWGTVTAPATLTTGTGGVVTEQNAGGANLADLDVTISTADGSTPVLEGSYSDTLTVKVGPTA